jgi:diadenylate cyclase
VDIAALLAENWLRIVEVLAVATLFYYILLAVRGTKAAVVVGIAIALGLVYYACDALELITLRLILDQVLYYGPLALLIIFAPEIRKLLQQATKTKELLDWIFPREEEKLQIAVLDTVVAAAQDLAESRAGALIVIERGERVDDHLVPGTELQAVPTVRLITSLFNKYNPLHDGALLIRDDRAAVGLTERCDAVVVVVSEERGELSVAFNGRLARGLGEAQFGEQVRAVAEPNETFASIVPRAAFI